MTREQIEEIRRGCDRYGFISSETVKKLIEEILKLREKHGE